MKDETVLKRNESQEKVANCGVYYFYHIGKTGGTSVVSLLREMHKANPDRTFFIEFWWAFWSDAWGGSTKESDFKKIQQIIHLGILSETKKWMIVHHHHGAPGLREMIPYLNDWKKSLREEGCECVLATILRDPLSNLKSSIFYNDISKEDFFPNLLERKYRGQVDYLLHNRLNDYFEKRQTPAEAVNEVVKYLDMFDVVGQTTALDDFVHLSEALTGFNLMSTQDLMHSNKSTQKYNITVKMEEVVKPFLRIDYLLMKRFFKEDYLDEGMQPLHSTLMEPPWPYTLKMEEWSMRKSLVCHTSFLERRNIVDTLFVHEERFPGNTLSGKALVLNNRLAFLYIWKNAGVALKNAYDPEESKEYNKETGKRKLVAIVRDPIDHFFSAWAEVCHRTGESNQLVLTKSSSPMKSKMAFDARIKSFLQLMLNFTKWGDQGNMDHLTLALPQANFMMNSEHRIFPHIRLVGHVDELGDMTSLIDADLLRENPKKIHEDWKTEEMEAKCSIESSDKLSRDTIIELCNYLSIDYFLFGMEKPIRCRD